MQKNKLKVIGIMSCDLFRNHKVFNMEKTTSREIVLFCDYSSFDIPLEYEFKFIESSDGIVLFSGTIKLKEITQEFILPFDQIPKGYKTLCRFEFVDMDIPKQIFSLPIINSWHESNQQLYFGV